MFFSELSVDFMFFVDFCSCIVHFLWFICVCLRIFRGFYGCVVDFCGFFADFCAFMSIFVLLLWIFVLLMWIF